MDKQSQLDRKREETGNDPSHGESITVSNRLVIDELSELHSEIHMFNYNKNCSLFNFYAVLFRSSQIKLHGSEGENEDVRVGNARKTIGVSPSNDCIGIATG